jgi:Skp family chaperone for outer membrane proteins
MRNWMSDRKDENYQKARVAVNEVAAKDGYTMVFEGTVALYGANDISDPTLAALNAKP